MFQVEHVTLHQLDAGVHRGRVHDRRELLGVARDRLHAGHEAEDVPLPTAAPNIALVVGVYVDPNMHEVSHFCLPDLLPVLKNTVRQLYEVFEYYETILATLLPYTCYKQAFVDQLFEEVFNPLPFDDGEYSGVVSDTVPSLHEGNTSSTTPRVQHSTVGGVGGG